MNEHFMGVEISIANGIVSPEHIENAKKKIAPIFIVNKMRDVCVLSSKKAMVTFTGTPNKDRVPGKILVGKRAPSKNSY